MMRLFDSHCHLQDERIIDDLDGVLLRGFNAGVKKMLCCGSSEKDWDIVGNICASRDGIVPAFGIHPWYVNEKSSMWLARLERKLEEYPEAAVGEIGLDHKIENRNDNEQLIVFEQQLGLAAKFKRPVSMHCRKAWGDLLMVLEHRNGVPCGGVVHSYSGSPELIEKLEKYGLSISFSGSITYERNRRAREACGRVSAERLLLETDCPDIKPCHFCGRFNEPAGLIETAATVAVIRDRKIEEIAELTFNNAEKLFVKHF